VYLLKKNMRTSTDTATSSATSIGERLLKIGDAFERAARSDYPNSIASAAKLLVECFEAGGKLLVFGNGGSASDAQHLCGELVVRFQKNRRALGAIALCCDAAVMTACSNDFAYTQVFARQIEALGRPGDVALGISTSGASPNVIHGLAAACRLGLRTILFTGNNPPHEHNYDLVLSAPGEDTARVQELHLAAYHLICELIDNRFS
jgi:D-sedoheptulose 7-phosphate isomerase